MFECNVDVADNDNDSHASPVHHGHTIWRHFANRRCKQKRMVEPKPRGGWVQGRRIRLTGLLQKKPWKRGFFYACRFTGDGPDGGFMEPLGTVARRESGGAGNEPLRIAETNTRNDCFSRRSLRHMTAGIEPANAPVDPFTDVFGWCSAMLPKSTTQPSKIRLMEEGEPTRGFETRRRRPRVYVHESQPLRNRPARRFGYRDGDDG